MNIFVLDGDIDRCARYHCDQHVVKMILESVQLLCTALNKKGFTTPYRSTHMKHPCVLWVEQSYDHFLWLAALTDSLNREYRYRFDKQIDHASMKVLAEIQQYRYQCDGMHPFAQAMPDAYKVSNNPVRAYRNFYRAEKRSFARWTSRSEPRWMNL
jgi:hypothetical protein